MTAKVLNLILAVSMTLPGCFVSRSTGTTHVITIEPDGGVVEDECVPARQVALGSTRVECQENGVQVVQECNLQAQCTYTRNGELFRECKRVGIGLFSKEADCVENGIHVDRKCDTDWDTVTCKETRLP
jgi:hypothetical protein